MGYGGHHQHGTARWSSFGDKPHSTLLPYRFLSGQNVNYDSGEVWLANGAVDAYKRANKIYKERLQTYQQPSLDPVIDDALRVHIEKRKIELQ